MEENDKLPTPAKPSLKMRLFCDENKRQLLRSVFENNMSTSSNKENQPQHSNKNKWLSTKNNKSQTEKKPRILSIDDSF